MPTLDLNTYTFSGAGTYAPGGGYRSNTPPALNLTANSAVSIVPPPPLPHRRRRQHVGESTRGMEVNMTGEPKKVPKRRREGENAWVLPNSEARKRKVCCDKRKSGRAVKWGYWAVRNVRCAGDSAEDIAHFIPDFTTIIGAACIDLALCGGTFDRGDDARDARHLSGGGGAKCLRNIHGVRTVGHILDIIQRNYHRHSRRRNCACNSCRADRLLGCDYPYKCQEEAIKILDCIDEKWDPRCTTNQPNAELTAEERTANSQALEDKKEVIFDPRITLNQPSSNGFRIFCNINCNSPANQLDPLEEEGESFREAVYIGNAHEINEDGEHCSAGGVWYGPEDPRNTSVRVEKELASKEGGVVAAILYTIQNSPREVSIDFWINSKRILRALTTDLDESEDKGWIGVNDKVLLKTIVAALRGRGTRCTLREAGESEN
ncbi:hypothetical protein FB451DRAFT_1176747 [Mycena latifolia]|nr:hypothetical protein FB451DRAFT_1176747 [Mycena latifolia]